MSVVARSGSPFTASSPKMGIASLRLPYALRKAYALCNSHFATRENRGEKAMANVYVEARPKGRPEGSPIDDYVVEDHADRVIGTFTTQREAIDFAKSQGHAPLVARVRHLSDKKKPDHWRAA
jgi:hypothetical protein